MELNSMPGSVLFNDIILKKLLGLFRLIGKLGQNRLNGQPGKGFVSQVGAMTAPWIIGGRFNHSGANRIQMQISRQLLKITVRVNQNRLIATLKNVTDCFAPPIDPASVTEREVLHNT